MKVGEIATALGRKTVTRSGNCALPRAPGAASHAWHLQMHRSSLIDGMYRDADRDLALQRDRFRQGAARRDAEPRNDQRSAPMTRSGVGGSAPIATATVRRRQRSCR